jgi:hypothetical protein
MNLVLLTFLLALFPSKAHAELPPWVYEEMKENAHEYLAIRLTEIVPTQEIERQQDCLVQGMVRSVNRSQVGLVECDVLLFTTYTWKPGTTIVLGRPLGRASHWVVWPCISQYSRT